MTMAVSKAVERGQKAVHLRLHRQHLGLGRGLRGAGGHHLRGARAAGQDRDGQARPGRHARRQDAAGRRQLRRLPRAGPQADRRLPAVSLVNSVNPYRIEGQKTAAFEIVEPSGTRRTCTSCRSATRATSPRTGRATPSITATGVDQAAPHARHPGRGRRTAGARGARSATPRPSPPRSASASRPRGTRRVEAQQQSNGRFGRDATRRSSRPTTWSRGRKACSWSPRRRPASPACSKPIDDGWVRRGPRSCARSPATDSRTPTLR